MSKNPKLTNIYHYLAEPYASSIPKLTVLSMGLGQDSVTILLLLIYNKLFREKYAPNDLVVIFSDTGNEHELTYKYRDEVVIPLCEEYNIPFFTISNDMGFHGNTWQSLTGHWEDKRAGIQTLSFQPTCSHNLKINPQEKFMDKYLADTYKLSYNNRKKSFLSFTKLYGKINWLIGIALKEESRTMGGEFHFIKDDVKIIGKVRNLKGNKILEVEGKGKAKNTKYTLVNRDNIDYAIVDKKEHKLIFTYTPVYDKKWKNQTINTLYPLIDQKMDRHACQEFIKSCDVEVPLPSSCMFCPYGTGLIELLWLYKTYPLSFDKWIEYERKKIEEYKDDLKEVTNHYYLDANAQRIKIVDYSFDECDEDKKKIYFEDKPYEKDEVFAINTFVKIVNHGVSCKMHKDGERKGTPITLNDLLKTAKEKYGHMSYEELHEYKMSHGHCVSSKY